MPKKPKTDELMLAELEQLRLAVDELVQLVSSIEDRPPDWRDVPTERETPT